MSVEYLLKASFRLIIRNSTVIFCFRKREEVLSNYEMKEKPFSVLVVFKYLSRSLLSKKGRCGRNSFSTSYVPSPYFPTDLWIFIWRRRNRYSPPPCFLHQKKFQKRIVIHIYNRTYSIKIVQFSFNYNFINAVVPRRLFIPALQ